MKKWLVLGLLGLAVAWGPYVYSQLTSSPVRVHGKARHGFAFLSGDEQEDDAPAEGEAAEAPAEEPGDPAAEEAKAKAASEAKAAEEASAAKAKKLGEAPATEPAAAKPGDTVEPAVAEEPAPTLPSELSPAFHKVFDAEPRDAFWANDEEPKIHALFKAAGAAPEAISELACRTTVCRMTFIPDELDPEALGKLYAGLRTRYAESLALEAKGSVGEKATLFVLRPGYQLEH
jgi:hypothetical protein